jgi:hypothetical protein
LVMRESSRKTVKNILKQQGHKTLDEGKVNRHSVQTCTTPFLLREGLMMSRRSRLLLLPPLPLR